VDRSVEAVVEQLGRNRLDGQPLIDAERLLQASGDANSAVGYDIQTRLAVWFSEHGQGYVAGYKIGATARGMQALLGVPGPVYGHIMSKNILAPGLVFTCNPACEPGIECEIAFRLGEDLPPRSMPHDCESVAAAIDAVLPVIEIVENRYGDYRACSLALLTADDFFHKACVAGTPVAAWRDMNLAGCRGYVSVNGSKLETGRGADVLGNPINAVAWLANKLAERGMALKAGQIVSTGSMTPVHWLTHLPAEIEILIEGVGTSAVSMDSAPAQP
jgi:2-oxo-3-hexenedioate decarboxylase/2-keto-4-pentenoate hydratase